MNFLNMSPRLVIRCEITLDIVKVAKIFDLFTMTYFRRCNFNNNQSLSFKVLIRFIKSFGKKTLVVNDGFSKKINC